ncbi:MAG: aspartate kinase [Bdellovibrionota bacterium]
MTSAPGSKSLIIQKYGGSSLAEPEQILAAADRVAKLHHEGHRVIVVVSAMGKTTDQLVALAGKVSSTPNRRELDMLLTTGERVSMALMSMALNDRGIPAISFTGSQAGVLTDELHSNARIIDMKPSRVETELSKNEVIVLAGFQGVSPKTKEITTLGRGGSDTTAVAMAAYFKAECCEIRKDVDGVHSADPHLVYNTRHLPHLNYEQLLDMTFWGAKVLHYRSVELAALLKIPVRVCLAHGEGANTLIDGEAKMYEKARVLSVNTHKDVRWLRVKETDLAKAFREFTAALKETGLPLPQFLDSEAHSQDCAFLITGPAETLAAIESLTHARPQLSLSNPGLSSVTATCQGTYASPMPDEVAQGLAKHQIPVQKMMFGAMSISVVVDSKLRDRAVQVLHELQFS